MPDIQQHKDPREIYPTNSASEDDSSSEYQPDDEPTLLNPKAADEENQPSSKAGERTPDTQTFGTTAATEPAAEVTHPHEESQTTAKYGAKQLKSAQQHRLMSVKGLKLRYEDLGYNEEREMVSVKCRR